MIIGDRLRELRDGAHLSQRDVEKRTGLLRCYISRVENGHTVPSIETLEKMARALEVPIYKLFYDGDQPPVPPRAMAKDGIEFGRTRNEARYLFKLRRLLARIRSDDRLLLLQMAKKVVDRNSQSKPTLLRKRNLREGEEL